MSSNGTNGTDTNGGGGGGGGGGDALNWVALVVSLVALLGTIAQVLQQYYASAAGFSNCGENVMGEWYKTTKRIFRPTELRFEVQFEAPVIFVCPPTNKNGPVRGAPIHYVDGSDLEGTRSLPPVEEEKQRTQPMREKMVHTADNERATWVTLLSQLHTMELDSREWCQQHYPEARPELEKLASGGALQNPDLAGHTLAIAVQAKQRSWDNMPTDVKKPYATTTICHILEIAAMMGIFWKEFDRSKDRYRAEGNGYILTGTQITDLGLMFTFQISGASRFQENRVIPVDEVKELCCGSASTLFRADKDSRRLGVLNEDPRDIGILQLGSMNEIAETMVLIDCNTVTASYFRKQDSRHSHLFPVPFELLGMLSKTLHIRKTPYRRLPNPTPYRWDKNFFNLRKLINEYHKKIRGLGGLSSIANFTRISGDVVDALARNKSEERRRREAERKLVAEEKIRLEREKQETQGSSEESSNGLTTGADHQRNGLARRIRNLKLPVSLKGVKAPERDVESQTPEGDVKVQTPTTSQGDGKANPAAKKDKNSRPGYSMELLDSLDDALAECDKYLKKEDRGLVRTVLREHFQEVLKMLNDDDDEDSTSETDLPAAKAKKKAEMAKGRKPRKFEELRAASPEDRQKKLMDIYFDDVLDEVKQRATKSFRNMTFPHKSYSFSPSTPESPRVAFLQPPDLTSGDPSDAESDSGNGAAKEDAKQLEPRASAIWCVLVFRMLCWLTLHDFDKNDVQHSKSELLGSRLPVYIA